MGWMASRRQWSDFPSEAVGTIEKFSGSLVRESSKVLADCEAISGILVGTVAS